MLKIGRVLAITALPVIALGALAATQVHASASVSNHRDAPVALRKPGSRDVSKPKTGLSDERIRAGRLAVDKNSDARTRNHIRSESAVGATSGNIGTIGVTVACVGQNHQMVMYPTATEGSNWDTQYVSYRLAYTSNGQTYYTGWYQPKLVDGVQFHSSYLSGDFTTSRPQDLGTITASNVSGVGQVWVRGAFWNGSAYEYSDWVGASLYSRYINGGSLGGSAAPCVIY
ncbi:MAG TPA: hypothetical protein VL856_11900 [Acidimicrobiia bacterium]|jgi:hypothetical protein|nr:hypothetical protein [Acidimicrobiia bacterium]